MLSFDEHVAQSMAAPFTGWDFRWMNARTTLTRPLPWSMSAEVSALAAGARRMLDVSWAIPDHGLTDLLPRLRRASENAGRWPLTFRYRRFLVTATKP